MLAEVTTRRNKCEMAKYVSTGRCARGKGKATDSKVGREFAWNGGETEALVLIEQLDLLVEISLQWLELHASSMYIYMRLTR